MEDWKREKISKLLSYVLRHNPKDIELELDIIGWAFINELITKSQHKMKFSREELNEVVEKCDKQRFTISKDSKKIRAAQGHSIDVDLKLDSVIPPNKLYHGTAWKSVEKIMKEGLKKMKRHHVHMYCEDDLDKAKNTGARHEKSGKGPVILEIDAENLNKECIVYLSDNNVYLTNHVPAKYITIKE